MASPSERCRFYADDVLSGKIITNKWIKLACKRFLNDLDRSAKDDPSFPYRYDEMLADRAVNFMEKMPHTKGKWAQEKKRLVFEPWQCFSDCNVFGWVHKETGLRRFRVVFELLPRKNGKSAKVAARGIYMFCADGESGAEVYCGATSEKQAFEVFRPAWQMVKSLEPLRERFGIEQAGNAKNPGTMFITKDMSKFEPVIGKPGDGSSPSCGIVDEYHEHDTDHMVDTFQTGMGAREQPLLSIISTAGSNLGAPCFDMQMDVQRILEGSVSDETVFGVIYGIDEDDDWTSEAALVKANPNLDVSVFREFLIAQLEQAKRSPSKQNSYRTKHLNEWVGAKTAWMNMVEWSKCRADIRIEDFKGVPCRMSADLSSKKDATAVDITFFRDGKYWSFKKFFVPEAAVEENERYKDFHLAGELEITEGAMLDQERVEEHIKEWAAAYGPIDITFDEWNADYMMSRLAKMKLNIVKFPFNVKNVSEPMKQLEALVLDDKYRHDGNGMMTWMMGNVAAKEDIRGNIFPNKSRPNDPFCKKDGVDVSIMTIARYMTFEEPKSEPKIFFI